MTVRGETRIVNRTPVLVSLHPSQDSGGYDLRSNPVLRDESLCRYFSNPNYDQHYVNCANPSNKMTPKCQILPGTWCGVVGWGGV
jgi:hypothetical protein